VKILITGGRGMLGSDMAPVLQDAGHSILVTDVPELDVSDRAAIRDAVSDSGADLVIHMAAMTNVDACELSPDDAYLANTVGTQNVAVACQLAGAELVYLSTISVFSGTGSEPYTEFDVPDPISAYSRSKYHGELVVRDLLQRYYVVRAGWMFGGGSQDKKFVAKIIDRARTSKKLTVVNDKYGSPTYTADLSRAVEKLICTGLYGTYHLVNTGGFCSRYEFAQAILEYAGITDCDLRHVSSEEFPLPAPRPRMEAARNYQLELRGANWMRPWREALCDYIYKELL